jgi:hypothetical protein
MLHHTMVSDPGDIRSLTATTVAAESEWLFSTIDRGRVEQVHRWVIYAVRCHHPLKEYPKVSPTVRGCDTTA